MKTTTLLKAVAALVVTQVCAFVPWAKAQTASGVTGITLTSSAHHFFADRTGTITFTVAVTYTGTIDHLGVRLVAPTANNAKWTYVSATGPTAHPAANDLSPWEFSYTATPVTPATFTVTLNYASGLADATDAITALQIFTVQALVNNAVATDSKGTPIQATVALSEAVFHKADTNTDLRLGLDELLKVVQIYNTRNGNVRTGAYNGTTYEPDPTLVTPVAPTTAHSADTDKDGAISLLELMRVMDLSKYTSGGVRTGEYHVDSSSIDGFAVGP